MVQNGAVWCDFVQKSAILHSLVGFRNIENLKDLLHLPHRIEPTTVAARADFVLVRAKPAVHGVAVNTIGRGQFLHCHSVYCNHYVNCTVLCGQGWRLVITCCQASATLSYSTRSPRRYTGLSHLNIVIQSAWRRTSGGQAANP